MLRHEYGSPGAVYHAEVCSRALIAPRSPPGAGNATSSSRRVSCEARCEVGQARSNRRGRVTAIGIEQYCERERRNEPSHPLRPRRKTESRNGRVAIALSTADGKGASSTFPTTPPNAHPCNSETQCANTTRAPISRAVPDTRSVPNSSATVRHPAGEQHTRRQALCKSRLSVVSEDREGV